MYINISIVFLEAVSTESGWREFGSGTGTVEINVGTDANFMSTANERGRILSATGADVAKPSCSTGK